MFVLIIVTHYYMVCLTTVLIARLQKEIMTALCICFALANFHHISNVRMDLHCLPVSQRSLNSNLLDILQTAPQYLCDMIVP